MISSLEKTHAFSFAGSGEKSLIRMPPVPFAEGSSADAHLHLGDLGLQLAERDEPVRLLRNGRRRKATGLYFSVKSGRHLPYESALELHDLWRAECDTNVLRAWVQPFTLHYAENGRCRRYTPDRIDQLSGGRMQVVEVKGSYSSQADEPCPGLKVLFAARGLAFVVRTEAEIREQPTFGAVESMQIYRRTTVLPSDHQRVAERLHRGAACLGELKSAFSDDLRAMSVLSAMVVQRTIQIDLDAGLHEDALVRLVG